MEKSSVHVYTSLLMQTNQPKKVEREPYTGPVIDLGKK